MLVTIGLSHKLQYKSFKSILISHYYEYEPLTRNTSVAKRITLWMTAVISGLDILCGNKTKSYMDIVIEIDSTEVT